MLLLSEDVLQVRIKEFHSLFEIDAFYKRYTRGSGDQIR